MTPEQVERLLALFERLTVAMEHFESHDFFFRLDQQMDILSISPWAREYRKAGLRRAGRPELGLPPLPPES